MTNRLTALRAIRVFLFLAASAFSADRPNVVLVMTDDQGYGDLSCHGNPVLQTPHLDQLHSESLRFTNYHVSPTCTPTRGALMSGHYTNRAGTWHTIMGRSLLLEGEATLGQVFGDSGYATGMFGKWHMGDNYPFRPEDRGFQEVVRHGGGGVGQTPDNWDNSYFDDTYFHNKQPQKYEGYCSDVFFSEAKRFIEESVAKDKPFFAYITTNAPHGPFHCPDKSWKKYVERLKKHAEKTGSKKFGDNVAVFFGMIENIDDNVGSMRAFLAEKGLAENTVFIFATDNGTASGRNVHNSGMKGQKGSAYEGGHRVPLFVHWPAGISKTGDVDRLCAHIDVLPTLIEMCGLKAPVNYKMDGKSLMPLINDPQAEWADRTIITDSQRVKDPIKWKSSSTMTQRWRMINGKELYDIESDPGQAKDVAGEHADVVAKLRADYDAWWDDISPVFEKDARIIIGNDAEKICRLTCHDWLPDSGGTPWNQAHIRKGHEGVGHWALKVDAPGKYRIVLRRWDDGYTAKGRAIGEGLEPGAAVPGLKAYRETKGVGFDITAAGIKIGSIEEEKSASSDDDKAVFEVDLKAGEIDLQGYFMRKNGKKIGSYYAYVEKL